MDLFFDSENNCLIYLCVSCIFYTNNLPKTGCDLRSKIPNNKGWFPLGLDCRRGEKNSLFLYLALSAKRERSAHKTKWRNKKCFTLRLMETSLKSGSEDHYYWWNMCNKVKAEEN